MTTFNTGNPLGSSDPRDLYDNAENLDEAVNSQARQWVDRLGKARPTIGTAIDPTGLVQDAVQAAVDAESARDDIINTSILTSAAIYETTALGLGGTDENDVFWVYPNDANELENLVLYRNVGGEAVMLFEQYNLNAFMIEEGANWETGEL